MTNVTYHTFDKLAANVRDLRRFARQHIWNAPNRDFGENAEQAIAELPGLRRERRAAQRAEDRWQQDMKENHEWQVERWRERQERMAARNDRLRERAQKDIESGDDPAEVAEWLDEQLAANQQYGGEQPQWQPAPGAHAHRVSALDREIARRRNTAAGVGDGSAAGYRMTSDQLHLHGEQGNAGSRLLSALHENNERRGFLPRERAVGVRFGDIVAALPEVNTRDEARAALRVAGWPRDASHVLPQSSHILPSIPLRDVNIANTVWGDDAATHAEAADLQRHVAELRHTEPNALTKLVLALRGDGTAEGTEIEEIGRRVPGAQRILENARILPGAPVPETPAYVRHAQRRLRGENPDALGHRFFDALGVPLDDPLNGPLARRAGDWLRRVPRMGPLLQSSAHGILDAAEVVPLDGSPSGPSAQRARNWLTRRAAGAAGQLGSAVAPVGDWARQRAQEHLQNARQRLIGAGTVAPPSDAVRERLQQIVDRHEASIAPVGPARLNRNELRMIDNSFDRTYNPEFPQLLAKRVPSPQTPATPLPAEQRDAFREALAAQPGLTRRQFLARQG